MKKLIKKLTAKKEPKPEVCRLCNGSGRHLPDQTCPQCEGTGKAK